MTAHKVDSSCSFTRMTSSSNRNVIARRAASMDDQVSASDDERRVDDETVARSAHSSPTRGHHKLTWLSKGGVLRGEFEVLGSELRRVGASLRGSIEHLVNHCTCTFASSSLTAAASKPLHLGHRRIKVELMRNESCRSSGGKTGRRGITANRGWSDRPVSGSSFDDYDDDDEFGDGFGGIPFDAPAHNFTSCLTLATLDNGQFAARLNLTRIPHGDITIRVLSYRLEVIVDRVGDPPSAAEDGESGTAKRIPLDDAHRVSRPFYCGSIDVPIYVDTASLQLQSADDGTTDTLYISARMKGYVDSSRLSASVSDVRKLSKTKTTAVSGSRGENGATTSAVSALRAGNHNWITLFRDRAYTR